MADGAETLTNPELPGRFTRPESGNGADAGRMGTVTQAVCRIFLQALGAQKRISSNHSCDRPQLHQYRLLMQFPEPVFVINGGKKNLAAPSIWGRNTK